MGVFLLAGKARFLFGLRKFGSLSLRLLKDARVATALKAAALVGALLIISPLDLFSDIPFIGPLDDIALLILLAKAFVWLSPADVVAEHQVALGIMPRRQAVRMDLKNVTPPA